MTGALADPSPLSEVPETGPLKTVLFVATPAALGGSNRSLVTLLSSLRGRVLRVVAAPEHGAMRDLVDELDLADEYIGLPKNTNPRLRYVDRVFRLWAGFKIFWWTIRHRRDVQAIHANALTGLNMAAPAAIVTRLPVVTWVHDPVGSSWGSRLGPLLRRLLPEVRFAAVSSTAEDVAIENGLCRPGEAVIVPNPIDPADVLAIRGDRKENALVVGFVGGASPRKGFDLLPDVVRELEDLDLTWKLFIATVRTPDNTSTFDELGKISTDTVRLMAKTSDPREVYETLDIVFCPSREESFCRVAAEAMMNGLPVVGSDIPPIHRLLGEDEAGILFPVGDASAAALAIRQLAGDTGLRDRLGAVGKDRAAAFPPEAIADQFVSLYGLAPTLTTT